MKKQNKLFIWEDNLKKWIETHRITWCFTLFLMGMTIGLLGNNFLGANLGHGIGMGLLYGFFLVSAELFIGGKII